MLSLYYRGTVNQGNHQEEKAIDDLNDASQMAAEINNSLWKARIYDRLSEIYYENYLLDDAMAYTDTAIVNYGLAGKRLNQLYCMAQKAAILEDTNHYDESISLFDSVLVNCGNVIEDSILAVYCLKTSLPALIQTKNYEKAGSILKRLSNYSHLNELASRNCAYYAQFYIETNDLPTAAIWLNRADSLSASIEDEEMVSLTKAYYEKAKGDYKSGFYSLHDLLKSHIILNDSLRKNSPLKYERNFYNNQAVIADEKANFRKLIIIALSIICILIIIYQWTLYSIKSKFKNLELSNSLNEIRLLTEKVKLYEENEKSSLDNISVDDDSTSFTHRIRLLSLIGDNYHQYHGTNSEDKTLINRYTQKEIEYLKRPGTFKIIENAINARNNDILVKFRNQLSDLREGNYQFVTYVFAGLSLRTLSLVFEINLQSVSNKISRLRSRVLESNVPDKQLFLDNLVAKQYFLKDKINN